MEIFHSLTDGAGVIWFMETLIYHYMTIRYGDIFGDRIPELNFKASISQKMDDSFGKNYNKEDNPSQKPKTKKEKKKKISTRLSY